MIELLQQKQRPIVIETSNIMRGIILNFIV